MYAHNANTAAGFTVSDRLVCMYGPFQELYQHSTERLQYGHSDFIYACKITCTGFY